MTERTTNEGGNPQEGAATTVAERTRRKFLAAAAVATGGLLTGTASADTGREIVDDGYGHRYADGDYGSSTVTDSAFAAFQTDDWTEGCELTVKRHSDAVKLGFDTPFPFHFGIDLTREESAALREELRYAEEQIPPQEEENGGQ